MRRVLVFILLTLACIQPSLAHAVESRTLVKEDDGVFRVIGDFIK